MEFIFTKQFNKKYKKLDSKIKKQFKERREILAAYPKHPLLNIHKLHGEFEGSFGMNVTADCRAIFNFSGKDRISFVNIGTHSQLYGK